MTVDGRFSRRRIPWGTLVGWVVLILSGAVWGVLAALALARWIG